MALTEIPAQFVSTIDHEREGYIRCNALGHSWHDYDSNWTPDYGIPLTLRCGRCGMERRDAVTNWGKLLNRHYFRPPHYKYPKGSRPSKDEFRVMLLVKRIHEAQTDRKKKTG
jgi:hypothetical protein